MRNLNLWKLSLVSSLGAIIVVIVLLCVRNSPIPQPAGTTELPEKTSVPPNASEFSVESSDELESFLGETLTNLMPDPEEDPYVWYIMHRPEEAKYERQQIAVLETESTQESLENLSSVDWYFRLRPNMFIGILSESFPIDDAVGRAVLDSVASNRRVLKLLDELSVLSKADAANLIGNSLSKGLNTYATLYTERQKAIAKTKPGIPMAYAISDNRDGTPTFMGQRYQIFALVYLAGQLNLQAAHDDIRLVAREGQRQRELLYGANAPVRDASRLVGETLYNRQILAIGLTGTAPKYDGIQALAEERGLIVKNEKLTHYDAMVSTYDNVAARGVPPDFSKGTIEIKRINKVSDLQFDDLLSHVSAI